jgi:hypothetical protein
MSDHGLIKEIKKAITIPVMAKARIGEFTLWFFVMISYLLLYHFTRGKLPFLHFALLGGRIVILMLDLNSLYPACRFYTPFAWCMCIGHFVDKATIENRFFFIWIINWAKAPKERLACFY